MRISIALTGKKGTPWSQERKDEWKLKMSGINNPWFGKHFSEEHRQKLSEAHKGHKLPKEQIEKSAASRCGKHLSEETKHKISERRIQRLRELGYLNSPETREKLKLAFLGHHHSQESKKKISEGLKGIRRSPETRRKISAARMKQILPNEDTSIEQILQSELKKKGILFQTHYPVKGLPDIVIPEKKIAVFADGCYWHGCPICGRGISNKKENDLMVNSELESQGWSVLRFWEHEIRTNLEGCVDKILECAEKLGILDQLTKEGSS
jgi:DNA mismatch endonuclease (patch repair protein)